MMKRETFFWLYIPLHFVLLCTVKNTFRTASAFSLCVPTRTSCIDPNRENNANAFVKKRNQHLEKRKRNQLLLSVNPNDLESPEERKQRLEWVNQISKSFYMNETGVIVQNVDSDDSNNNHTVLTNVPLWRVQWTELPGFQNVLNCHVPHYTHMFRKVLYGPKPWYFGHVYLPRGSENLENPDYFLCSPDSRPDVTHVGTLMKISDYKQLEDGRLMLIVQALNKFQVTHIHQHLPFAVATVELLPDQESVHHLYKQAQQHQQLSAPSSKKLLWEAAKEAAVVESLYWENFEYRNVLTSECIRDGGVSPLANFNQTAINEDGDNVELMNSKISWNKTLANCLQNFYQKANDDVYILEEEYYENTIVEYDQSFEDVMKTERNVWIALDFMLQLLTLVNPNPTQTIPIPTQILGLIPMDDENKWPDGFKLDSIAAQMSLNKNQVVGTWSKSPFVMVSSSSTYPKLRRAQRFSFAIWSILDTLLAGYDPAVKTRQSVLELTNTKKRLLAAERGIQAINQALQQVLKK